MSAQSIDVLLVEDNPGDALLVTGALAHTWPGAFEVRRVASLSDAMSAVDARPPAVVLLDLSLPDSRGLATLNRMRSSWPALPIIVLTGLDDDEVGVTAMQAGAQDYLSKDEVTGKRLGRAIRFAIERAEAVRQVQQWRERYTLWIQQSADGLWDWSLADGKVLYSPGWRTALGLDADEVGETIDEWFDRVLSRDASRLANELQTAIETREPTFATDYRIRNKDGRVLWMRARGMVVLDGSGQPIRVAGSQTDVTHEQENPCTTCGEVNQRDAASCSACGAALAARPSSVEDRGAVGRLPAGALLGGRYRVEGLIDVGGAGAVYVARDERTGRHVATKVLHPWLLQTPESRERFTREGQIQTRIDHPHVVRVWDVVSTEDCDFIVMEYVPGPTLRDFVVGPHSPVSPPEVVSLFRPVIEGIAAAHDVGVVHRDVKPENILVAQVANGFALKITDFGVAKIAGALQKTRTGAMLGTLQYMAPEQFVDARAADGRADIYALGCTLFELLTRRPPFAYDSEFRMMTAHLTEKPPHPREFNPLVSRELGDVILVALAKDPADRHADCRAFADALQAALDD